MYRQMELRDTERDSGRSGMLDPGRERFETFHQGKPKLTCYVVRESDPQQPK
jgi:hypothetical protein